MKTPRGSWVRAVLGVAAFPFVYYLLALHSTKRFFGRSSVRAVRPFQPPISNLKPVRGSDPDAYENFASFCRQDYPQYEVIFCVDGESDPAVPLLRRLQADFPNANVRVLFGSGRVATNDKVAKLARMVSEATFEYLVISDSDVRVQPNYLRTVIGPLADPSVGATTCFYVSSTEGNFIDQLQSVGMLSDFYASMLVARQLDGVKFALGPTIATTRSRLAEFGGYASIENKPADDLWVGRLIAEGGHRVELLNYAVETVPDFRNFQDLILKRMRWLVVQRHMRPFGHMGFLFTQGLPWTVLAILAQPTPVVIGLYAGTYLALRISMLLAIGSWGLRQANVWKKVPLLVAWDGLAFAMWTASFFRRTIRWRNADYRIVEGNLVPLAARGKAEN